MKKAILFGASGFIGSHLLTDLLNNPNYEQVIAVVRKPLPETHTKLKMLIGDFQTLPTLKQELVADEIFIALGTTRKNTPQLEEYYRVDHDYPLLAAKIAKDNGATSVFIVTAIGADANSRFFYIKTKGEIERDIKALDYSYTHIFQPSMIVGSRQEKRTMEKIIIQVWNVIDSIFIGGLNRFKGIDGKDVAKAMALAANTQTAKVKVYQWSEMNVLLSRESNHVQNNKTEN